MTREQFDALPPLIHRKVFLRATGLNHNQLPILVKDGTVRRLVIGAGRCGMYYKEDAARLCGYIRTPMPRHD